MPEVTAKKTIRELRKHCQHTYYNWNSQPWLFRQFRRVSIYLTWLLLHTSLTPNAITLAAIASGIMATVLFALGYWIVGVVTLLAAILLDFSDGEVSRYRGTQSREGSYLDKIYIFSVHPSLLAGMTIGVYNIDPTVWVLVAGFIDAISVFLFCMVTEYGRQIAVWKHCRRFLDKLHQDPVFLVEQLGMATSRAVEARGTSRPNLTKTSFDRVKSSKLAAIVRSAAVAWDFPHIFFIMAFVIVIQLFIGERNSLGPVAPMRLFLYFYAISYPLLICLFLLKNVSTKVVEREYAELAEQIGQTLEKARRL